MEINQRANKNCRDPMLAISEGISPDKLFTSSKLHRFGRKLVGFIEK